MKMNIVGLSASAPGQTSKAGKAVAIGALYTLAPLAPAYAEGGVEKGQVGTTYRCDPELVRRIAHLPLPVVCEVEVMRQVRFGEPEDIVMDVRPLETIKKVA
ncbi:MAG: hypothetical protein ABIR79_16510 [Candidatus Binatia bacterium]